MSQTVQGERKIARQIMELVSDPEGREYIAGQDGCVEGLVKYLNSVDLQTVVFATKAIEHLTGNKTILPKLCDHPEIMTRIVDLQESDSDLLRKSATKILENFNSHVNREESSDSSQSQHTSPSENAPQSMKRRTIVLRTPDTTDPEIRGSIQHVLIKVHGVISVTVMKEKDIAVVYAHDDPNLCSRLSKALDELESLTADEVRTSVERFKSFKNIRQGDLVAPRRILPRYMENPEQVFNAGDSHVERFGSQTLAQRRAAKRAAEREARQRTRTVARYIGKIAGGIGKGLSSCGIW